LASVLWVGEAVRVRRRGGLRYYRLVGHRAVALKDALEWATWFGVSDKERQVGFTPVGPYSVSTVFLGIDHNFLGDGPALLFETMTFNDGDQSSTHVGDDLIYHPLDIGIRRYATWDEAERGHAQMVQSCRDHLEAIDRAVAVGLAREKEE